MELKDFRLAKPEFADAAAAKKGADVRAQMIRDLYDRSGIATLAILILFTLMRWAIDPAYRADGNVRDLFMLLVVVNVSRWGVAMIPPERRDALFSQRTQYLLFAAGVLVSAALLGALVVMTWPQLATARICILAIIIIISGLFSGAVLSEGINPPMYFLYLVPSVGSLFVMSVTDLRPSWGAEILATLFIIYALAVLAISIEQQRSRRRAIEHNLKLSDLAVRDTLTNLHNRRFLKEFMSLEAARISRDLRDLEGGGTPVYQAAVGLFMLDLDHFKQVNDTYGHPVGDELLKQTADVLTTAVRHSDIVVRWGGEEFVIIARSKHREHTAIVAEKLRSAVDNMECKLQNGKVLHNTCSIGYCLIPFFADQPRLLNWEEILGMADAALMIAKTEGRNRWVGVLSGPAPWADVQHTYYEVVSDVKRASEQGFVTLDRYQG